MTSQGHRPDWASVDWTLRDVEIARQLEVARSTVCGARKRVGAPPPPDKWRKTHSLEAEEVARRELRRSPVLCYIPLQDLSRLLPVPVTKAVLGRIRREVLEASGRRRAGPPYDQMNFDLRNRDLERIWRLPYNAAANARRRLDKGPAGWDPTGAPMPRARRKDYSIVLRSERAKAAAWRRQLAKRLGKAQRTDHARSTNEHHHAGA